MNGSLSGVLEQIERGSRKPATRIRQRKHSGPFCILTDRRWFSYWWLIAPESFDSLCLSTGVAAGALCWIALLLRTQPSPRTDTHTHTHHLDPICFLLRIFPKYTWKNIVFEQGLLDLISPLLVVTAVAEALRGKNTWLPLSKRRSSFAKGVGFFLLETLLSLHGCPQFKGADLSASCVDYINWNAQWETRPFLGLPDRESKARFICLHALPV